MTDAFVITVPVVHGFPLTIRAPPDEVAKVDCVTLGSVGQSSHNLGVAEYGVDEEDDGEDQEEIDEEDLIEGEEEPTESNIKSAYQIRLYEPKAIASGDDGEHKGPWTINNSHGLITENYHGDEGDSDIHAVRGKIIK